MKPKKVSYHSATEFPSSVVREEHVEYGFIGTLQKLKYQYRPDIRDRAALEQNFREKFEALNRVHLTDSEFSRLLEEIITPDVFSASRTLRAMNSFTRDDGTPLNYTLVNIKDWCKNTFEVVNQLRINTDNSHHRYDVIILINGVPCAQIELKMLGINPRRAMEQIVEYRNDPGNGYTKTLLCFLQLFIVSNHVSTYHFANNNARHFAFNADERFLPIAIEDQNVLKFHVDYFKPEGNKPPKPGEAIAKKAVVAAILAKHDQATAGRRFNALLATASINDAIEYHGLFKTLQAEKQAADPDFVPLNIACVFSPPAEGDKNLKHHGLIQAFSRTNRVLNGTKPYGNILDFRQQQDAVDAAIALFSGEKTGDAAREIWLVDKAPVVIKKLEDAVKKLDGFMKTQGLDCAPEAVPNLKGDEARAAFINHFKEVQRLKTQLDQYTDLTEENAATIEEILPKENLLGFRGAYLETAQRLKAQQGKPGNADALVGSSPIDQLDFEFVIFASAVIDYDYIMGLISRFTEQAPGKQKMSREQLIGLIQSDAKFMNEREDIADYIATLKAGEGLSEKAIRDGYTRFKAEKDAQELAAIASQHGLTIAALQGFVDSILDRMIFDGEHLGDLMAPLDLGWKARTQAELALMADLHPLLTKRAQGRDISGLSAYEQ
jgi:type I site-specific restriction-modification system R (restriction) subunit